MVKERSGTGGGGTTCLPPELQHFFKVVLGMEWPEGSEGGLRAIGHAWGQFGGVVGSVAGELPVVSGRVDRSFDGVTASAILEVVRGDLTSGLEELRVRAAGFARQAKNAAADMQKAKMMLIVFAALTLAAIIELLWTVFGAILVPVVKAAARLTITAILQVLKTALGQVTVRQAGQGLVKLSATVAQWAAGGAGLMVFVDFVIQGLQIATDGREGWDPEALKGAAIGGAIGGAAGGVFHGAATGAGKFFAKEFRHKLPRGWQKIFDIAGPSVYSFGQVLMVVISNPFVFLATKDKDGVISEGILSALAAPGGGKGNGVTGPGATVLGRSFLDKLDQLGLGWLKPATATATGGVLPAPEEKKPLAIPEAAAAPVSVTDSAAKAAREIVSSNKRLLGTVFGPESSERRVVPAASTGRSVLLEFLGGVEKTLAPAGSWNGQAAAHSPVATSGIQDAGGSRGVASGTPAKQGQVSVPATDFQPSMVSGSQPSGVASVSPLRLSQVDPRTQLAVGQAPNQGQWGAGPRTAWAAAQNQSHLRGPDAVVGSQPQTPSRAGGEPPSAARIPDRQSMPSSPAVPSDRVAVIASGTTSPPDRTTPGSTADATRSLRSAGEPLGTTAPAKQTPGKAIAESSLPPYQSRADRDGSPRHQTSAVKPPVPLSSRDGIGPQPTGTVTSDEPARPSPVTTPQVPGHPAVAAGAGGRVLVPLSEVVVSGEIRLKDVDFVPLTRAGGVVGMFFPLEQGEVAVVRSAFEAGAYPGAYALVGHGRGDGIRVRLRSGGVVTLNAAETWGLLSTVLPPGMSTVMVVSCWADNPARGGFLGRMRQLAHDAAFPGTLSGSTERARIRQDNPWIEELAGEPAGPVTGGVGFDEHGVPYVDLATPDQQSWLDLLEQQEMSLWTGEEQSMAGPSRRAGGGPAPLDDLIEFSPVEGVPRVSGQVPDALLDAGVNGPVVASWRGELGAGVDGGWSEEAAAELAAFVEVFVGNSVRLDADGREPLDAALVMRGTADEQWITLLFGKLKNGLLNAGLNPDTVHTLFDRVKLGAADGEAPSVGVVVRDSPNRQVGGYMGAKVLPLSFVPGRAELTKASRRRLEWLAQGFILRWVDRVQTWLVVNVPEADKDLVEAEVKAAIHEAARPWMPDASATSLADLYVEFRVPREPGVTLRIEGDPHDLNKIQIEPDLAFPWHEQITAARQGQPSGAAAKRKATGPTPAPRTSLPAVTSESAAAPHHDTMRNPQEPQGTTFLLLNNPKTARHDAKVVDWWHMEPPTSGPPATLSQEEKKSMSEFAKRLLQHKPEKGGVPWDIQVHLTDNESQLESYGDDWFERVKEELRVALMGQDVPGDSDLLKFDFDYIKRQPDTKRGLFPSVDIIVYDTVGQMIKYYQSAQSFELFFIPYREDLAASSRRKLHWRMEGFVDGNEHDQGLLMFELQTQGNLRTPREKSVAKEIKSAAQQAHQGKKSDEEIKNFIQECTALKCGSSKKVQRLFVDLIQKSASLSASLPDSPGVVEERAAGGGGVPRKARKEWQLQVAKTRANARAKAPEKPAGESGADALFKTSEVQGATSWLLGGSRALGRDVAEVVDQWHVEPPESGPLVLSDEDKASMCDFADRLLRRKPVKGGVPWDIQLHVAAPPTRSKEYYQETFSLLEEGLKVALMGQGCTTSPELLKFDFDHIKHRATKKNPSSVDILVYDITGQMIRYYRDAQQIELFFIPYSKNLVASSRRKLRWRLEGLEGGDEIDQSLLELKLSGAKAAREGLMKSVSQQVKVAAEKAYPRKSDEEIESFIKARTKLIYVIFNGRAALSVSLKRLDLGAVPASPQDATGATHLVPFLQERPVVRDVSQERTGGDWSGGVDSQAREAQGMRQELEPGGGQVPNVADPPDSLSWLAQDTSWPEGGEASSSREQEGGGPGWGGGPYDLPSSQLIFDPAEGEYFHTLGFTSPGAGEPVPLSDLVTSGENDPDEVEFVALTDGAGDEVGTLLPQDRG
ncbi:WXG100-like domain-containing protein [Amycolatopsis japonica]